MRKTNKKVLKKQRNIIMISVICLTLLFSVGYAAFSTNIILKGKGNIKEKSRVIQSWTSTSNTDFHNQQYRESIVSITFLDTAKVPSSAVESWDVSSSKDKGVMAYVTINEEDNTKYDLFIGAKDGVIANENSTYLFNNFINVKSINFNNNFDTSNATNIAGMFYNCKNLLELDLSSFNTSNVESMYSLLYGCNKLTTLDLSSFNTSKTSNMYNLFYGCNSLKSLDLSNFNTSKITDMTNFFANCNSLTSLNLGDNFNTSSVKSMENMFMGCTSLSNLDISNFDTSKVTNMKQMFQSCIGLTELDISNFNTSNVSTMYYMFNNCPNLITIYASDKFITTNVTNSTAMFSANTNLVGGNGTTYSSSHTDKEYARIDTASTPGYFTLKTE